MKINYWIQLRKAYYLFSQALNVFRALVQTHTCTLTCNEWVNININTITRQEERAAERVSGYQGRGRMKIKEGEMVLKHKNHGDMAHGEQK